LRYPPNQKQLSRSKVLAAAGRVFRRRGFRGAGIDAVMKEAGMTKGAFSQHFRSKDELLAETIEGVLTERMDALFDRGPGVSGRNWVRAVVCRYLSVEHLRDLEDGCPVPALLSELSRADRRSRAIFQKMMRRGTDRFAKHLAHLPAARARGHARAIMSACFGALALARAMYGSKQAEEIITSARDALLDTVESLFE